MDTHPPIFCADSLLLVRVTCYRVPGLEGQLREEAEARELEKLRADELQAQQDKEAAQNELVSEPGRGCFWSR